VHFCLESSPAFLWLMTGYKRLCVMSLMTPLEVCVDLIRKGRQKNQQDSLPAFRRGTQHAIPPGTQHAIPPGTQHETQLGTQQPARQSVQHIVLHLVLQLQHQHYHQLINQVWFLPYQVHQLVFPVQVLLCQCSQHPNLLTHLQFR